MHELICKISDEAQSFISDVWAKAPSMTEERAIELANHVLLNCIILGRKPAFAGEQIGYYSDNMVQFLMMAPNVMRRLRSEDKYEPVPAFAAYAKRLLEGGWTIVHSISIVKGVIARKGRTKVAITERTGNLIVYPRSE